jgi:hypothetical protein
MKKQMSPLNSPTIVRLRLAGDLVGFGSVVLAVKRKDFLITGPVETGG